MFEPKGPYLVHQEDRYGVAVGLFGIDSRLLEKHCMNYIETMLRCQEYPEEVTAGETSSLRGDILKAVLTFSQQENVSKYPRLTKDSLN